MWIPWAEWMVQLEELALSCWAVVLVVGPTVAQAQVQAQVQVQVQVLVQVLAEVEGRTEAQAPAPVLVWVLAEVSARAVALAKVRCRKAAAAVACTAASFLAAGAAEAGSYRIAETLEEAFLAQDWVAFLEEAYLGGRNHSGGACLAALTLAKTACSAS